MTPLPLSTHDPGDDLQDINRNIATLGLQERQGLVLTCGELLEYMEVNVTPFLSKCLVNIEREQPEDPIAYLIEYMREQRLVLPYPPLPLPHRGALCSQATPSFSRYFIHYANIFIFLLVSD